MRALLLWGAQALLARSQDGQVPASATPATYAEMITFAPEAKVDPETVGWTRENELASTYCAAPLALPGAAEYNVWAVGRDCCNDGRGFACFSMTANAESGDPPYLANTSGLELPAGDGRVGLKVQYEMIATYKRAAERSSAWFHGRTDASKPPIFVYLVGSAINQCGVHPLVVCGDGKTEQSCPPPIAKAYDLACPGVAKCMRAWSSGADTFKHVCVSRPFSRRYIVNRVEDKPPDWWDEFRERNPNHPALLSRR